MTTSSDTRRLWLDRLDRDMRREITRQRNAVEEIWRTPLATRVGRGEALGPLEVVSTAGPRVLLRPATGAAEQADCSLREGDFVCLSVDEPLAPTGHFIHAGEDDDGIHLLRWKGSMPAVGGRDWVIDPDFYDMTARFAEAIEGLAASELGRDRVLPILMGDLEPTLDPEAHERVWEDLEDAGPEDPVWHDSQQEAIAACVAANDAYLVQGPPGTGKTRVLAEVARRLIERGERVLVTGPTHRAIHQALSGVRRVLSGNIRVVKIGFHPLHRPDYECFDDYASSGLLENCDPQVIAATPHALWSKSSGLREVCFDSVLLDEASQLTPLLAAMAMLRAERWLFFGDDRQLPPVVIGDTDTPPRERSVFGRMKHRGFDTMLEETWRLSPPLAEWPSATFYGNRLVCRHDLRLQLAPAPRLDLLRPDPAAALALCEGGGPTSVRSNEEAQLVVDLIREAVRGGLEPERIAVITPFRAQAARIRQVLRISTPVPSLQRRIAVDTVDRLQGQERDLILVSLAASEPRFIRLRADFLFQPERWNVAVTRARLKTVIVASPELVRCAGVLAGVGHEGAACFASLVDHLQNHAS